ncbi:Catechol 2,3-dioxygenase [Mariniphaga anaerophila]|uniref:Catechol 2,3-dioxygenase n=1 Tax=Mariniphaga anaerophila TaxID=1484053 RepID=A0A1M4TJP2_9BACT|nr:VOC family protein [Mariniphaga anaerophila]SHE44713.1 Catechol 2,3-dioxygenase [Mariniphaga anaerophila]
MTVKINGIQQLGVGVENLQEAWKWYREHFAMDIRMFEDEAVAELMLPHTAGKPRPRHAVLALNMQGGGGFEIWQHKGKKPQAPETELHLGDLGINIGKLKTDNIQKAFQTFSESGLEILGQIEKDPSGNEHFYLKDNFGNLWEIRNEREVFRAEKSVNGGVLGAVIGVKNMDESLKVYTEILQYDKIVFDETGVFSDLDKLPGGEGKFRRVLLKHSEKRNGAFSPFFGSSYIELVQALDREPRDIFEGRIWGDPGFIHLCFDINGIDELREQVKEIGFPFTVDSARDSDTFDMGEAAGSFAYIQAPEGTLIEFVETHKIPILKKVGWFIDFRKRGHHPLPNWLLKLFRFKRVKDK